MARRLIAAGCKAGLSKIWLAAPVVLGALLGGCSSLPGGQGLFTSGDGGETTGSLSSLPAPAPEDTAAVREYWATAYAKNPHDEKAVISFAHALKADGSKDKALSVLQQAAFYNPGSKTIAGEEGRVALDMGQASLAEKLLTRANDAASPDWRILNALGTLEAQRGNRAGALGYFEKANRLAPNAPAVLNNLALAYALGGDPARAEALLRKAAAAGGETKKIRQNLALVLGVEGKTEEAQQLATADLGDDQAKANRSFMEKMVAATPMALGKPMKPWKTAVETVPAPSGSPKPVHVPNDAWVVDVASAPSSWSTKVAATK